MEGTDSFSLGNHIEVEEILSILQVTVPQRFAWAKRPLAGNPVTQQSK
jgi:hypothetical protein